MASIFQTVKQYLSRSAASTRRTDPVRPGEPRPASTSASSPSEFGVRKIRRSGQTITIDTRDFSTSSTIDLRELPSSEFGVQGYSFYLEDKNEFISDVYRIVREPSNRHDPNAIAVFSGSRKIGHVSATKAGVYAPILDALDSETFLIGGVVRSSGKLLLRLPTLPALRDFARVT